MSDLIDRLTRQRTTWEPLAEDAELARFFTDAEVALQAFEELVTAVYPLCPGLHGIISRAHPGIQFGRCSPPIGQGNIVS